MKFLFYFLLVESACIIYNICYLRGNSMAKYNKNNILIGNLLDIVNKASHETTDVLIAKIFLENRYNLNELSLDDLSNQYYISQASISRFIKKLGYKNYNTFKYDVASSNEKMESVHAIQDRDRINDAIAIKEEVIYRINEAYQKMNDLNVNDVLHIVDLLNKYQNIIFFGSELSMAMCKILQLGLVTLGKNVYTIYDKNYQNEMINEMSENDLLICISIEDRWFHLQESINNLKESTSYKMMWTLSSSKDYLEGFDDIFVFGKQIFDNYGYHELMVLIMIVYRVLMNHSNNE